MRNFILLVSISLLTLHCSTVSKKEEEKITQKGYESLSMEELQQSLGLELEDLGMAEKTFNSCSLPKPLREDQACGNRTFTLIHFRVQCRSTVGTTEQAVGALDLKAMHKDDLEWVIGPQRGFTFTDSDGYGYARIISKGSLKKKRFVLKRNKIALGLTAEDVSRIIVPANWCD
jgi:hypothetical protein